MDSVISELQPFINCFPFLNEIKGKTFFVTGASGFIGSAFVRCLIEVNKKYASGIKIYCFVRNKQKAAALFGDKAEYIEGDFNSRYSLPSGTDYIVNCASPTASKYFTENPVKTLTETVRFGEELIKKAVQASIKSYLYVSSLEVYGVSDKERVLKEDSTASFDFFNVRNSYPLSKIVNEELAYMYFKTQGLPAKTARLTQTFGAGMSFDDNRAVAQFARAAVLNEDIVLTSKGETKRNYAYMPDAVAAMFYILIKGENGQAYNVANDDSYISIYDLAQKFISYGNGSKVVIKEKPAEETGYLPVFKARLDNSKLKALGWQSHNGIGQMVEKFVAYFRSVK